MLCSDDGCDDGSADTAATTCADGWANTSAGGWAGGSDDGSTSARATERATAQRTVLGTERDEEIAQERPALRVNNPRTQSLLQDASEALARLREAFDEGLINSGDALGVSAQLHRLSEQVRALHYTAVAAGDESGMWAIAGYLSTESWLRHTHLLPAHQARDCARTARWLRNQPLVAEALADGDIKDAQVQVMRRVATSSTKRAGAFPDVAGHFVEVARNADTDVLGRVLRSWGDAVDADASNRHAARDHERRRVFLSPVGHGWDLQGWLPTGEGAELAGLLTERMEQIRRETPDISMSAPQRRADALMDLLRSAASSGLLPAQRERARVQVLIPLGRLANCANCRNLVGQEWLGLDTAGHKASGHDTAGLETTHHRTGEQILTRRSRGPDLDAAEWRSGNGVGRGTLSMADARRLSCDGQIQRVVLSADSVVLDVGRSSRLATPAIRNALEVRDGGCVVPECDRPPGWCEAHHVVHWSAGGSTSLQNMALLCSRHHHELHEGNWHIEIDDGGRVHVQRRTARRQ